MSVAILELQPEDCSTARILRRRAEREARQALRCLNPSTGPNRAERRRQGHRHGDVSLLVHARHDRAWLYSGTVNASGRSRINAKRNARAAYWAAFAEQRGRTGR